MKVDGARRLKCIKFAAKTLTLSFFWDVLSKNVLNRQYWEDFRFPFSFPTIHTPHAVEEVLIGLLNSVFCCVAE